MSLPANLPAAVTETILIRLTTLFLTGANGDQAAARDAASHMLDSYKPETEDELRLAANIIGFSFQALEALAQSADPGTPVTRVLRLRSGAVSLNREAMKAERSLAQLKAARAQPEAPPKTAPEKPVATAAKVSGVTWTQAYEQRQRDARIAASIKRAEARVAASQHAPPEPQMAAG